MNDNEDLISVIVPVYKVEKYLDRCVKSILNQVYTNFEIILVDDESPDNCPKMCDDYAARYDNIVAIHLKNSGIGVSGARNAGVETAKGKYVTFIDSDDFAHDELLSVLKKAIDSVPQVQMSMCSYKRAFDLPKELDPVNYTGVELINDMKAMDMLITDQTRSAVWGKLYARDLFDGIKFPVGRHNEDMFVMPLIFQKAKRITVVPQELYFYFQDSESLCRSTFNYNMLDMIEAIAQWKQHITLNYPALIEKVNSHYYSSVINSSQYLVKKKDDFGISKLKSFEKEIVANYKSIIKSKYTTLNNKIKTILFKLGLFKTVIKTIDTVNIRKYD